MAEVILPQMPEPFNISPSLWGANGWVFMHNVSLSYPLSPTEKDKMSFYSFFVSIGNVLPCEACRVHYKEFVEKNSLTDALVSKAEW